MRDNFNFKKSLGQNFLYDENICRKIVESASIDKDTMVLEIGPGKGAISKYIIDKCKYFIMYEVDERLRDDLNKLINGYDNASIVFNDFLDEDVSSKLSKYDYKKLYVVANLPYYITTPIISKLINDNIVPDKIVVMVQREVADRYSSKVGSKDYSSLTVFLNYYYNIKKLFDVSRNSFIPVPRVDSSVICMEKKSITNKVIDDKLFNRLVRDSFKYKRKTIRNNLSGYNLDIIEKILNKYNMDLSIRAENIGVDIFVELSNALYKYGEGVIAMDKKVKKFIDKEKVSEMEFELVSEIAGIRMKKGITQSELALETGINQPNIARFEKNIHSASLSTTIKILNALGYKLTIKKK